MWLLIMYFVLYLRTYVLLSNVYLSRAHTALPVDAHLSRQEFEDKGSRTMMFDAWEFT